MDDWTPIGEATGAFGELLGGGHAALCDHGLDGLVKLQIDITVERAINSMPIPAFTASDYLGGWNAAYRHLTYEGARVHVEIGGGGRKAHELRPAVGFASRRHRGGRP